MKVTSRTPGPAGHLRSRLRILAIVGTAAVGSVGLLVAQAGPAAADTTVQEIAVGSDVTQDVMNQFSVDLSGNVLDSLNAADPLNGDVASISYIKGLNATEPATTCTYTRPHGSDQGLSALRESINPATTATPLSIPAPQGCVDIGRSSSGPTSDTRGALAYIPFAEDTVTGAVGPATGGTVQGIDGPVTTVATNITQANLFTEADLVDLYTDCNAVTVGGVTYWPFGSPTTEPAGAQQIDLYVPQVGSETRGFWAVNFGFNADTLPACVFATIQNGANEGTPVEDYDGEAVATDPDGYMPFSISQWVSQSKHTVGDAIDLDRRYGAVLQDIVGSTGTTFAPYSGTIPNETVNAAFPIGREVYNIVEACRVDSTASLPYPGATCSLDPTLESMLSGSGSSLCQDQLTIVNYGFSLLVNNSNEPNTCGQIAPALRSQVSPV